MLGLISMGNTLLHFSYMAESKNARWLDTLDKNGNWIRKLKQKKKNMTHCHLSVSNVPVRPMTQLYTPPLISCSRTQACLGSQSVAWTEDFFQGFQRIRGSWNPTSLAPTYRSNNFCRFHIPEFYIKRKGDWRVEERTTLNKRMNCCQAVSYTHLTLPTKRIV